MTSNHVHAAENIKAKITTIFRSQLQTRHHRLMVGQKKAAAESRGPQLDRITWECDKLYGTAGDRRAALVIKTDRKGARRFPAETVTDERLFSTVAGWH